MELIALFAMLQNQPANGSEIIPLSPPVQTAAMCFLSGERDAGMNKICYYDCTGGTAAITVKSHELCPLSISD